MQAGREDVTRDTTRRRLDARSVKSYGGQDVDLTDEIQ